MEEQNTDIILVKGPQMVQLSHVSEGGYLVPYEYHLLL